MDAGFIVALVLAVPIILLPVAYVWYLNIGGILSIVAERRKARRELAEGHAVTR